MLDFKSGAMLHQMSLDICSFASGTLSLKPGAADPSQLLLGAHDGSISVWTPPDSVRVALRDALRQAQEDFAENHRLDTLNGGGSTTEDSAELLRRCVEEYWWTRQRFGIQWLQGGGEAGVTDTSPVKGRNGKGVPGSAIRKSVQGGGGGGAAGAADDVVVMAREGRLAADLLHEPNYAGGATDHAPGPVGPLYDEDEFFAQPVPGLGSGGLFSKAGTKSKGAMSTATGRSVSQATVSQAGGVVGDGLYAVRQGGRAGTYPDIQLPLAGVRRSGGIVDADGMIGATDYHHHRVSCS